MNDILKYWRDWRIAENKAKRLSYAPVGTLETGEELRALNEAKTLKKKVFYMLDVASMPDLPSNNSGVDNGK